MFTISTICKIPANRVEQWPGAAPTFTPALTSVAFALAHDDYMLRRQHIELSQQQNTNAITA